MGGSGEHPAVREFRRKLESVADGACAAVETLNRSLDERLTRIRTPVPPALPVLTPREEDGELTPSGHVRSQLQRADEEDTDPQTPSALFRAANAGR